MSLTRLKDKRIHSKATVRREAGIAITANTTLEADEVGGLFTVSGTAARTVILPSASLVGMTDVCFRSLSAHAHVLSGAAADAFAIDNVTGSFRTLTFAPTVGHAHFLKSDGLRYHVYCRSGSLVGA